MGHANAWMGGELVGYGAASSAKRPSSPTFAPMQILGMPLDALLLLTVAVGFGLALEIAFYLARRHDRGRDQ
jgi:hypothetical protein